MRRLLICLAVAMIGLLFGAAGPTPASAYYHHQNYHYGYPHQYRHHPHHHCGSNEMHHCH
jgi:hypothetical protein